mmetsp:Transcript_5518/g.22891  ORF Transcript_5518/g.22891 Transcript_5518/m.22891 type:complete len:401 (-) Transcript_5518:240-1442(-)
MRKAPSRKTVFPPSATRHRSRPSVVVVDGDDGDDDSRAVPRNWPTRATSRPTLGSLPATHVLSSGPLTTKRASRRARPRSCSIAPRTRTRMTWFVPSPLRTTWCASCAQTRPSASRRSASSTPRTLFEANATTVSLVEVSPSTPQQPNVDATAARSSRSRSARETAASVVTKASIVDKSGSIMPAPLATPTTDAPLRPTGAAATLGYRSVVIIADATSSGPHVEAASSSLPASSAAKASTMASAGRRQPMTPVEDGRKAPSAAGLRSPRSTAHRAAASATRVASASPAAPVPTLLTLLLTTTPRTFGTSSSSWWCSRRRPTRTGAPASAFVVKTPATEAVGASSNAMSATFMLAAVAGSSTGEKVRLRRCAPKPAGHGIAAIASSHEASDAALCSTAPPR